MRARASIAIALLVVGTLAACRPNEPDPDTEPTPTGFTPTSGEAKVDVTGDVEDSLDMTLAEDVEQRYREAPNATGLAFVDAEGNRLAMAGPLTEGENPTSNLLTVDVSLPGGVFIAAPDQCIVTVHRADDEGIEGEIGCADISDDGERAVNVSGSFSASP